MNEKKFPMQILGPLFLVFTLFLAGKVVTIFNFDLAAVAVIGLYLSAKWHFRGSIYALVLLALSAGIKHGFLLDHHLWQAGFEASAAISFIITAMVFEESSSLRESLFTQTKANSQTILFLEEDLAKLKEKTAEETSIAAEKMALLRGQLEEATTEISTFGMLNEVLRKSTAKALEDLEICRERALFAAHREKQIMAPYEAAQRELSRLRDESTLAQQNAELFHELNEARYREEQTRLINETLVRMRASENQKVKEQEKELAEMEAFVRKADLELASKQLFIEAQPKIAHEREIELLAQIEQLTKEKEELSALQTQIQQITAEKDHLVGQIRERSQLVQNSGHYELLYRQLKGHFDEKNEIIHKTRAELFRTDTELQTLSIAMQHKNLELDPMVGQASHEVDELLREQVHLFEQIDQLHDLIAHLMQDKAQKKK